MARQKTATLNVFHKFTQAEKIELGSEMAEINVEIEETEDRKKNAGAQFSVELKELKARQKKVGSKIRIGGEERHVLCQVEYDFEKNEKRYRRDDNGEVVKTEQIPYHERQLDMLESEDDGAIKFPEYDESEIYDLFADLYKLETLPSDEDNGIRISYINSLIQKKFDTRYKEMLFPFTEGDEEKEKGNNLLLEVRADYTENLHNATVGGMPPVEDIAGRAYVNFVNAEIGYIELLLLERGYEFEKGPESEAIPESGANTPVGDPDASEVPKTKKKGKSKKKATEETPALEPEMAADDIAAMMGSEEAESAPEERPSAQEETTEEDPNDRYIVSLIYQTPNMTKPNIISTFEGLTKSQADEMEFELNTEHSDEPEYTAKKELIKKAKSSKKKGS